MPTLADYPPMLLEERPIDFAEPGWIYEIKFDGYRMTAESDGAVQLRTRNGADATKWFPEVAYSLARVKGGQYIVDGEVCVLDELGRSDFDKLQDRAKRRRWYEGASPVVYCVFDLLVSRGVDITQQPLVQRKAALAKLFKPARPGLLVVGHFDSQPERLFAEAVIPLKLEGLVAKRADSVYLPGVRSPDWVKVKRPGAIPAQRFKRGAR
ncbi:RNA ligase family protein [Variovorax sp. EBFNA2]|uniref:ATP-dependent DNA ligase n=1 Tax=Variovorax sp. EBFNA2 TaxID=3342097 RepID=UPI0029BFDC32|nr:RNA ligase family protein [Variovorax boronicumulans]WPG35287.1 RNA ligase family protein [Variovorax boronicumulans]